MAATKKTAATKTAAKKSATKTTKGPSGGQVGDPAEGTIGPSEDLPTLKAIEEVAQEVHAGKWNSGRERDDALRQAGHDPEAVQKEAAKVRAALKPEKARLPIPNSRRGSSWT